MPNPLLGCKICGRTSLYATFEVKYDNRKKSTDLVVQNYYCGKHLPAKFRLASA